MVVFLGLWPGFLPPGPILESVFLWRVSVDRNLPVLCLAAVRFDSNAVKRAFRLFFRSKNLGFGAFSGPNRPQESLEKAPGSGPDRFAPFFSPADQF